MPVILADAIIAAQSRDPALPPFTVMSIVAAQGHDPLLAPFRQTRHLILDE
jgi:hypothetical protein